MRAEMSDFTHVRDGTLEDRSSTINVFMADPAPIIACIEKERLLQAFAKAVSDYHRMQTAQVAAVQRGEDFPFQEELAQAAEVRDRAKYAVLQHRLEHGC